jgi:hypothetical protein
MTSHQLHAVGESLLFAPEESKGIVINNRILAKVNGKAISAIDVMKKMDMLFYRAFPEYTSSTEARFQFYQMNWKQVLRDLIDKELIMADAEEIKMQVSNGDVRQEMEMLFGPNIIANLDKVGLTFEEAMKMVHSDIMIKRMLYIRAQMKAVKQITPQVVRDAYEEFAKDHIRSDTWIYSVVTIREPDRTKGAEAAHQAYRLLTEDNISLNELTKKLPELASVSSTTKTTVSEEFKHSEKEMSPAYKTTLSALTANSYSQPISQKSRADSSTVYRIFFLKEFIAGGAIPFQEVAKSIKDKLIDEIAIKETDLYIKKLRKHFDVQESHYADSGSEEFEPFRMG